MDYLIDKEIIGNDASEAIDGGAGNDTITAKGGDDIIMGAQGNDSIDAGKGSNTLNFWRGHGNDTVVSGGGSDTLVFNDVELTNENLETSGKDLIIHYTDRDSVTIKDFVPDSHSVKTIRHTGGTIDLTTLPFRIVGENGDTVYGGNDAENIKFNG